MKVTCVLNSEWLQKEIITKWLLKKSTKHWQSLKKVVRSTFIVRLRKLLFNWTFLEVHLLLGTNQSRPLSVEEIASEFSKRPAEVITDRDDENKDEESDEQITHPSRNKVDKATKLWTY